MESGEKSISSVSSLLTLYFCSCTYLKSLAQTSNHEAGGLDRKMGKKAYVCKYCGCKMNEVDYELYKGYCGKCREVLDWKQTLSDLKELEK